MSKLFNPPEPTKWNVLNLGAGVQSSCLALMAAKGEITPMPDFAVFADTQAEPESVYIWLSWLESKLPFPVYRVTRGSLTEASLKLHKRDDGEKGDYIRRLIPAFGRMPNGDITAAIGRKCTADYKVSVIIKEIKSRCDIKRAQKNVTVTQWIGISWDEMQRMKEPSHKWTQHRWPLIERRMRRADCIKWMSENGYPEPPRSACVYCPFHSNDEWRRLRNDDPKGFSDAVEFERKWRKVCEKDKGLHMDVFLHPSCKPLDEIDFDSDIDKGQMVFDFNNECEGMCGI